MRWAAASRLRCVVSSFSLLCLVSQELMIEGIVCVDSAIISVSARSAVAAEQVTRVTPSLKLVPSDYLPSTWIFVIWDVSGDEVLERFLVFWLVEDRREGGQLRGITGAVWEIVSHHQRSGKN